MLNTYGSRPKNTAQELLKEQRRKWKAAHKAKQKMIRKEFQKRRMIARRAAESKMKANSSQD